MKGTPVVVEDSEDTTRPEPRPGHWRGLFAPVLPERTSVAVERRKWAERLDNPVWIDRNGRRI
jgi:hypothetical protein